MKTLAEIKREAQKSDYSRVAEIVGKSPGLVKKVISGDRSDHHRIQKVFSDLIEARQSIAAREELRRQRQRKKQVA